MRKCRCDGRGGMRAMGRDESEAGVNAAGKPRMGAVLPHTFSHIRSPPALRTPLTEAGFWTCDRVCGASL